MPTKKPQVKSYVEKEIYNKIIFICEKENRSISNIIEYTLRQYIEKYEEENGEIDLE